MVELARNTDQEMEAFNRRNAYLTELPNHIYIETFMGCNLRCPMCPVPEMQSIASRHATMMSLETYNRIIEQISDKPRFIDLNLMGEPLLNKHIIDFVKIAKEHGHTVSFFTNVTKLTQEMSRALIDANLDYITFSIDGATKDVYEKIRIRGKFEEVVENVRYFREYNLQSPHKVFTYIDCIESDLTRHELDDYRKLFGPFADRIRIIPLSNWSEQYDLPNEFGGVTTIPNRPERFPCHLLWMTLNISAEGNIMLCCHDYRQTSKLPNVMDKPLREIWMEELQYYRVAHTKGIYPGFCENCTEWARMPQFYMDKPGLPIKPRIHLGVCWIKDQVKRVIGEKNAKWAKRQVQRAMAGIRLANTSSQIR